MVYPRHHPGSRWPLSLPSVGQIALRGTLEQLSRFWGQTLHLTDCRHSPLRVDTMGSNSKWTYCWKNNRDTSVLLLTHCLPAPYVSRHNRNLLHSVPFSALQRPTGYPSVLYRGRPGTPQSFTEVDWVPLSPLSRLTGRETVLLPCNLCTFICKS